MAERLHIELTGDLPEAGKYAILASAEEEAKKFAAALAERHDGLKVAVSVRSVRPGKKGAAPAVPDVAEELGPRRRHAAE